MTLRDADLYAAGFTRLLLHHDTTTDPPRVGFRADKDGWQVVGCSIPGDESVSSGYKTNFPESMADIIAPRRSPITGGDGSRDWSHTERKVMGSFAGTRQDIAFFRLAELPHITERWRLGTTRGPDGSLTYERSDTETMAHYLQGLEAKPGNAEQSSEHRTPDENADLNPAPPAPAAPRAGVKAGDRMMRPDRHSGRYSPSKITRVITNRGGQCYAQFEGDETGYVVVSPLDVLVEVLP
jgi:hypothetical protein